MRMHVVLLGDSTFDNRAYTDGGPDVLAHVNWLLDEGGGATLLAQDGARVVDVHAQLSALRAGRAGDRPVTHLALSVGGNDLLAQIDVLGAEVRTVADALLAVRERAERFRRAYVALLDDTLRLELPLVVCTVYNGAFRDPAEAAVVETALRIFDHEIMEAALDRGIPCIDLRRVCNDPRDYWNPIEPGERGGAKIAAAVVAALMADVPRSPVETGRPAPTTG